MGDGESNTVPIIEDPGTESGGYRGGAAGCFGCAKAAPPSPTKDASNEGSGGGTSAATAAAAPAVTADDGDALLPSDFFKTLPVTPKIAWDGKFPIVDWSKLRETRLVDSSKKSHWPVVIQHGGKASNNNNNNNNNGGGGAEE